MAHRDPAKRIPKFIGTDPTLVGTYTITDAAVALFPAVLVLLAIQMVVPASFSVAGYTAGTLAIPLAIGAVAIGALFVWLTPGYTNSLE